MSRSKLHDKYMKDKYGEHNEAPKNKPSKYISQRCANVEWLQEPGSFGGHKPHTNGHRMASGIVRAKVKEEIRNQIKDNE